VRMQHHPEDGMDIKKEFEFVLSDKSVKGFFHQLRINEFAFQRFESLDAFVKVINDRTTQNYEVKDACLLKLIERIQTTDNKSAGLNLITYLLAPGLQRILYDFFSKGDDLRETWLNLWWQFLQSILNYPILLRPSRVSANLLYETQHRFKGEIISGHFWEKTTERLEDYNLFSIENESSRYRELAAALIEGIDDAGLDKTELDLVISSRVYGESMKMLARKWDMKYRSALQKRLRAEKSLRKYWKMKHEQD
jgi:hypothetical protein